MDALGLCNSLRMEFEGIYENKIPLDALPAKLQDRSEEHTSELQSH